MKILRHTIFYLLVSSCLLFAAAGAQAAEPFALQKVMKDLGKNMRTITDGIPREDWALVEKTAPLIADHPQPPMSERTRIMGFMGTCMSKFKTYDGETHEQAQAVGRAAKAKDGQGDISGFQNAIAAAANPANRSWRIFTASKDAVQ